MENNGLAIIGVYYKSEKDALKRISKMPKCLQKRKRVVVFKDGCMIVDLSQLKNDYAN